MDQTTCQPGIILLLDGLPVVLHDTNPDLLNRLCRNILNWIGDENPTDLSKIFMPLSTGQNSYGFALVRCLHENDVQKVIDTCDGKVIDVHHTLRIERANASPRFTESQRDGTISHQDLANIRVTNLRAEGRAYQRE